MAQNSAKSNPINDMFAKVFPAAAEVQTDHGGLNLGDIIVIVLDLVLFLYTGYRSWHFLSTSMPDEFQILALIGLWGLDIGMISWSLVWMYGSTTKFQNWASMTMFVLDLIGVILTSVIDTLMYAGGQTDLPPILSTIAWYGVPVIIIANVLAGFLYHMTSPSTRRARAFREQDEELSRQRETGELELRRMNLNLAQAQEYTANRTKFLIAFSTVADQNLALAEIEKNLMHRLNVTGDQALNGLTTGITGLNIPGLPGGQKQQPQTESIEEMIARLQRKMTAPTDPTPPAPAVPEIEMVPVQTTFGSNGHHPQNPM